MSRRRGPERSDSRLAPRLLGVEGPAADDERRVRAIRDIGRGYRIPIGEIESFVEDCRDEDR